MISTFAAILAAVLALSGCISAPVEAPAPAPVVEVPFTPPPEPVKPAKLPTPTPPVPPSAALTYADLRQQFRAAEADARRYIGAPRPEPAFIRVLVDRMRELDADFHEAKSHGKGGHYRAEDLQQIANDLDAFRGVIRSMNEGTP